MMNTPILAKLCGEAEKTLWPAAVAAARFIALTGFRRGEVLSLKWSEIDPARRTATLAETKTGRSIRPLSRAACDLLRSLSQTGGLVFPASRGDGCMTGFPKLWARIAKLGALPADVTPHVLRHRLHPSRATSDTPNQRSQRSSDSRPVRSLRDTCTAPTQCCSRPRMRLLKKTSELMGESRFDAIVVPMGKSRRKSYRERPSG